MLRPLLDDVPEDEMCGVWTKQVSRNETWQNRFGPDQLNQTGRRGLGHD